MFLFKADSLLCVSSPVIPSLWLHCLCLSIMVTSALKNVKSRTLVSRWKFPAPPNCCCFSARYILQSRVWNVNSPYRNIWSLNVRIDTQILIMSSILVELTGDVFLKEKGDLRWWAVLAWSQWERWASFQAVYPSRLRWVARGLCWRQSMHSKKTSVKLAPTELFSTLFQGLYIIYTLLRVKSTF